MKKKKIKRKKNGHRRADVAHGNVGPRRLQACAGRRIASLGPHHAPAVPAASPRAIALSRRPYGFVTAYATVADQSDRSCRRVRAPV